jgi:CRP-like cAMP-binding protein
VVSLDALKIWPFFGGLSDEVLQPIAAIARRVSLQEGTTIVRENTPASALYLLLEGWVDIVVDGEGRAERTELLTTLTQGDIFGWSSIVEPYVYTASAVAATPVSALEFPAADLLALMHADAGLCYAVMNRTCRVIAARLRATRMQLVGLFVDR